MLQPNKQRSRSRLEFTQRRRVRAEQNRPIMFGAALGLRPRYQSLNRLSLIPAAVILILILVSSGPVLSQNVFQGTITDADTGEPIVGAIVSSSASRFTTTDGSGAYELNTDAADSTIIVSANGYGMTRFQITGGSQQLSLSLRRAFITTFGGNGQPTFDGDGGPADQAALNNPFDVATDEDGNIYIADNNNNRIRKIDPQGVISTVAGSDSSFRGDGRLATSTGFESPVAVAIDVSGNLYLAERGVGAPGTHTVRKVDPEQIVSTLAGTGNPGFSGDGGQAQEAELREPWGIAVAPDDAVIIADKSNHRIRKVDTAGVITTIAGTGTAGFSGDGGPATQADITLPKRIVPGFNASILFSDGSNRIRRIDANGVITTLAGTGNAGFGGDGGQAAFADLNDPHGFTLSSDGTIYICDSMNHRIRRIDPLGFITTVAGQGSAGFGGDDGPADLATLNFPTGCALTPDGSIIVADSENQRVRKITFGAPTTGTIAGRITNAANGEGVRDATLEIQSLALTVATSPTGFFSFINVPAGSYEVTITSPRFESESVNVTVEVGETSQATAALAPILSGIEVGPDEVLLTAAGATQQLAISPQPIGVSPGTVSWRSSSSSIATVDSAGLVTAVGEGRVVIIATAGSERDFVIVDVNFSGDATPLSGLDLFPAELVIFTIGETAQLAAIPQPMAASVGNVTWVSSDSSVATVSDTGLVTAVGTGRASVTVSNGAQSATATINVNVPASDVIDVPMGDDSGVVLLTIGTDGPSVNVAGATVQVIATGTLEDGSSENLTVSVTWTSSDPGVATVDDRGGVLGVARGFVRITAQHEPTGLIDSIILQFGVPVQSVEIDPVRFELNERNQTVDLSGIATLSDGSQLPTGVLANWSSSDLLVATVVATDDGATVTALRSGQATITLELSGQQATAEILVKIVEPIELSISPVVVALSEPGRQLQARAIVGFSDGSTFDVTGSADTNWISRNTRIVTVDQRNGVVTAVAEGSTTIKVTYVDNGLEFEATAQAGVGDFDIVDGIGSTNCVLAPRNPILDAGEQVRIVVSNCAGPYQWMASAGTIAIDFTGRSITYTAPEQAGSETVMVTTDSGEEASITVRIVDPLRLEADTADLLSGEMTVLRATGGLTPYMWTVSDGLLNRSDGPRVEFFAPDQTGDVTVTLTDAAAEELTQTIAVTARGDLLISPRNVELDANDTQVFEISGGDPPYLVDDNCTDLSGEFRQPVVFTFIAPESTRRCTLTIVDLAGSRSSATINVTAPFRVTPDQVVIGPGQARLLIASGGSRFIWLVQNGSFADTRSQTRRVYIAPSRVGVDTVTITTDDIGDNEAFLIPITIIEPPRISPARIVLPVGSSQVFTVANGGEDPVWSVTAGNLTLSSDNAVTYAAPRFAGSFTLQVTTNLGLRSVATIHVTDGPLSVSPSRSSVERGSSIPLSAAGGTGRYFWSVEMGTLSSVRGRAIIYTPPDRTGEFLISAEDDAGNRAFAIITAIGGLRISPARIALELGEFQIFEAIEPGFNPRWEVSDGRIGPTTGPETRFRLTELNSRTRDPGLEVELTVSNRDGASATAQIMMIDMGLEISPAQITMRPNETHIFEVTSEFPPSEWSVEAGAIRSRDSVSIVYTAPTRPGDYHLIAIGRDDRDFFEIIRSGLARITVEAGADQLVTSLQRIDIDAGQSINVEASGGSGVYRWRLSDEMLGSLNTAEGHVVTFSAGGGEASGSLILEETGENALRVEIPVTVKGARDDHAPIITMAGFSTTPEDFTRRIGGAIRILAQVVDDGPAEELNVELYITGSNTHGIPVQMAVGRLVQVDGQPNLFAFSHHAVSSSLQSVVTVPGLTIRATDGAGNVNDWPALQISSTDGFTPPPIPAAPRTSSGSGFPIIHMAGFGVSPATYGSRSGGDITIQALVTGGRQPVTVEAQFLATDPDGASVVVELPPLTDEDGDRLFTVVFSDLPGGILPLGEVDLPGFSITATDASGSVAHWPQIDFR